ncbi:MAG: hypothetical protein ACRCXZ_03255 [Patescibacteria group bacterium]
MNLIKISLVAILAISTILTSVSFACENHNPVDPCAGQHPIADVADLYSETYSDGSVKCAAL